MEIVLVSPLFLPPIEYFRRIAEADIAVIDTSIRFDKRMKSVHRTVVSGAHGSINLTVPVSTPGTSRCLWENVTISAHNEWWRVMMATLDTLFGSTPYYSYFRSDLNDILNAGLVGKSILALDIELILLIIKYTRISTPLTTSLDPRYERDEGVVIKDLRKRNFYEDSDARSVLEDIFQYGVEVLK